MSSLTTDQPLLHYRILGKIGEGGMGEVYKAEDSRLGRYVAIKRLPLDTAQDEKAKQRLVREARSASALNHPNIVVIYAIEAAEGSDFIVMEYVEGETLKAMIGRGPLELARLLEVGAASGRGPRRGTRHRADPPRSQAGQHRGHAARAGQGARFRPGQVAPAERRARATSPR